MVDVIDKASIWQQILHEARAASREEPALASFYHASILNHRNIESALSFVLAYKLGNNALPALLLRQVFDAAYGDQSSIIDDACTDILAHFDRDPACDTYCLPFLYFKGFHALQAYRVARYLWLQQRTDLAMFLQSNVARVFDVDIHPGARIGRGIMIDHATGVVIGETAVVGNNVSMLHSVTLGGIGCDQVDRHPKVDDDVLISTGAKLFGNIRVGQGAKIAAGSLVLENVPAYSTVAGVPAVMVGGRHQSSPAHDMDHRFDSY